MTDRQWCFLTGFIKKRRPEGLNGYQLSPGAEYPPHESRCIRHHEAAQAVIPDYSMETAARWEVSGGKFEHSDSEACLVVCYGFEKLPLLDPAFGQKIQARKCDRQFRSTVCKLCPSQLHMGLKSANLTKRPRSMRAVVAAKLFFGREERTTALISSQVHSTAPPSLRVLNCQRFREICRGASIPLYAMCPVDPDPGGDQATRRLSFSDIKVKR